MDYIACGNTTASIAQTPEELAPFDHVADQYQFRKELVVKTLAEHGVALDSLTGLPMPRRKGMGSNLNTRAAVTPGARRTTLLVLGALTAAVWLSMAGPAALLLACLPSLQQHSECLP